MLEQEEDSHLSHAACCKTTLMCGTVDILEQLLDLKLFLHSFFQHVQTKQQSSHLVLAVHVDDDIFHREASLLAKANQHVSDGHAITCGGQRGTAVR